MNIWLYVLILLSSIIAGMGMGGGSIFLMLQMFVVNLPQKEAQYINLIMFIAVGISATIYNIKNKTFCKQDFIKIIFFLIIGVVIGANITKNINEKLLKFLFYILMLIIGIYEIITSVKNIKRDKL